MNKQVLVVGGGAAGFFAAIHIAESGLPVTILEKSPKLLSKVRISGGGRCNVLPACYDIEQLYRHYPRGGRFLRKLFYEFGAREAYDWFSHRGVALKTEADGRVFPVSDSSETIVQCLMQAAQKAGVQIRTRAEVVALEPQNDGQWAVALASGEVLQAAAVVVTTGGGNKPKHYAWLETLGLSIVPPVPSLFSFNIGDESLRALQGISVPVAMVSLPRWKMTETGPLLITHWGVSGPAVLRLSAWGARLLHEVNYRTKVRINWTGASHPATEARLQELTTSFPGKKLKNTPVQLPKRLWEYLCQRAKLSQDVTWKELSGRQLNALLHVLCADEYEIVGKTTFKEEFVTCGGVDLREISAKSMMSKKLPGLFFAGEVLDIDGITGGFNFQAAWTTAYTAAQGVKDFLL
ncbi:MAG: flavoprotein [Thermonema sp.]|uniref:NAD(P)/FAD-dependent oxidoreductase n=1 Tax=Thermonema sp. TaxID=2231181 RepID=UPI0021DBA6BA|nr:NAD(P)/FAD-dependent oxidoreductase [Thermonema sp.]GIV38234.1 MAG: flavoprotein [Thermonema sp.]